MEAHSTDLWLFDKKGPGRYAIAFVLLVIWSIWFPLFWGMEGMYVALFITCTLIVGLWRLPRVFAFRIRLKLTESGLTLVPLKQAFYAPKMKKTDVPMSDIKEVVSYGVDAGKNSFYHLDLITTDDSIRLRAKSLLSISSTSELSRFSGRLLKRMEEEGLDFSHKGETVYWTSTSMKIQMVALLTIILMALGVTIVLYTTNRPPDPSPFYRLLFLEFVSLLIWFNYFWRKFRKYNS